MRALILIVAIFQVSCGKNSSGALPNLELTEIKPQVVASSAVSVKAQINFVINQGGHTQTEMIELNAVELEEAASIRKLKTPEKVNTRVSNKFALYAPDVTKRLELASKFSGAHFNKAEIIIDVTGAIQGEWGWMQGSESITWHEKINKKENERLVLLLSDHAKILDVVEHKSLLVFSFENKTVFMNTDSNVGMKLHSFEKIKDENFDYSTISNVDAFTKINAFKVKYAVQSYNQALRYRHCVIFDNGDVGDRPGGGRFNKREVCSVQHCHVQMQSVSVSEEKPIDFEDVVEFDQGTNVEDGWFYSNVGDSLRLKTTYGSNVVTSGLVSVGSCAGKTMIDGIPGATSVNIAPRNIVKLNYYRAL